MTPSEDKLVSRLREWYGLAIEPSSQKQWRQRAAKALRFYDGTGQWSETLKMTLEGQGKPALTINRILPTVNVVWGQLIQNRTELRLEALKRGTKEIANLGSALIKHGMGSCHGDDASSDCFRDGIITGKGWTAIDQVRDRDPVTGELLVEAPNPLFVFEDPRNVSYSADAGEFIFRERFMTRNKLKAYYPNKYKDALSAVTADWAGYVAEDTGGYASLLQMLNEGKSVIGSDDEISGVVLREVWWKEYEAVEMATVSLNGRTATARIRGAGDRASLAGLSETRPDISVNTTKTVICTLHLAVLVGDLLIKHEVDPLNGMNQFPYDRFSPFWLHGNPFGLVDNLISPQEEYNKERSNLLHDANISGNPAWRVGSATPQAEAELSEFGSTPGMVLSEQKYGGKVEKIEAGGLSPAHAALSEQTRADIQEISGANPNLMGTPTERIESGRARLIQQEAGLKVLAPITSNFYRSQSGLGDKIWDFIRNNEVYSPEEIQAVVEQDIIDALGGMAGVVDVMNRWDSGVYAVKAVPSKTTSTWTDVQVEDTKAFAQTFAAVGLQMPPLVANEVVVSLAELMNFPSSKKIADMLRQQPAMPAMQQIPGESGSPQGTRRGAALAATGG